MAQNSITRPAVEAEVPWSNACYAGVCTVNTAVRTEGTVLSPSSASITAVL
jgi:hypothetical protein